MLECGDPPVQFVGLNGEQYAYRRCGQGDRTILLLHGVAETSKVFWRRFLPHFERDYSLVALDLRGHGDSARPPRGYTATDQAQLVAQVIDALGLGQPVLLGHSLGGIIATKFAILFPNRLAGLIVYDSPLGRGLWRTLTLIASLPPMATLLTAAIMTPGLGRVAFWTRTPKTMDTYLKSLRVFCDPSLLTPELLAETVRNSYDAISQSLWRAVVLENVLDDMHRIVVPTLIVRGEYDRAVPQQWSEQEVARLPKGRLAVIKNGSHLALIEQPAQFNQAVSQFLATI